jgi:hypothetical protein
MPNPVKTAQSAKGLPSFGATAQALLKAHPANDWGMKPRSLETQIGKLDRGEITWWINHAEVAKALGALLDLSLPDLGLHGNADAKFQFSFAEFPGLEPLDLRREKPWKLGEAIADEKPKENGFGKPTLDEWLNPEPNQWHPPNKHHWLYVPDGLEKRLFTQHLAITSAYRVVFTRTLEAASAELEKVKPLILVVDGDVSEEDFRTLGLRHESAGLLVVASVPIPGETRDPWFSMESMSWERRSMSDEQRRLFVRTTPVSLECWTWTLRHDWRTALLQWVEKRLTRQKADTLFDAQSLCQWLERFDPLGQWFDTPSNVLQLCASAHSHPHTKLPKPNDAEAGRKLTQLLFSDKFSKRKDQLQQWAVARWNRLEFAWHGFLPKEDWLSLLPINQLLPSAEAVHAIASAKTAPERKKAADRVVDQLQAGNPDVLEASELLKDGSTGQLDFAHPTLVRLIVRDKLMRQIAEEQAFSWGWACFDPDRSMLVDAALDVISMDTLMQAVQRLLREDAGMVNATSAAGLAASEALFVAIGRRIANPEGIEDKYIPLLGQLAEAVIGRLDIEMSAFTLPVPWSRPTDAPEQQLVWIGVCWACSLQIKAPDKLADGCSPNWLFPGWSESRPPPPDWLNSLWPEKDTKQISSAWKYFLKVADEWVKDWNQPMDNAPRILRLALLGRAAHGTWAADPTWWEDLIAVETPWAEEALLVSLESAGKSAAARLWPSYLAFEMDEKERLFPTRQLSSVRRWLLGQLSPADALTGLSPAALKHLVAYPRTLPPAFRAPLLLARCQSISFESFADTAPFIARFGPSALPALPELLKHYWLGKAAAEYLWVWGATTAEQLLLDETVDSLARYYLLHTCPASKIAVAAAALTEKPALFRWSEYSSWARSHLPTAGKNAQVLIDIIRSQPKDEDEQETEN